MRVNGILSYLISDILGSSTVALNSDGSGQAVQLFSPNGSVRYSWGSMPTTYNFTGQRLDSQTGLLYYIFRYYDSFSGRFLRADTMQNNASGMDPYAYVGDNPETMNDPSGHEENPLWNVIRIIVIVVVTAEVTPIAAIVGLGVALLVGSSILIANASSAHYGSDYPANGPQPTPAPTPTETQTPTPTPSTDTNGSGQRFGGSGCNTLTIIPHTGKEHYEDVEIAAAIYVAGIYSGPDDHVVLRPATGKGKTSDLLVNGETYDIYTPTTSDTGNIVSYILSKNQQATGIVLNLSRTSLTRANLSNLMYRVQRGAIRAGMDLNINDIIIMDGYHDENDHWYQQHSNMC